MFTLRSLNSYMFNVRRKAYDQMTINSVLHIPAKERHHPFFYYNRDPPFALLCNGGPLVENVS